MNRWQNLYIKNYCRGAMPKVRVCKLRYDLLGRVQNRVTIHFPETKTVTGEIIPARESTFFPVEEPCQANEAKGYVTVEVLAAKLEWWEVTLGYKIDYN